MKDYVARDLILLRFMNINEIYVARVLLLLRSMNN